MFDTIDERLEQDDPHSWKDWAGRAIVALVVVALLAGGIYLSVAGNG
jgi:predicted negative regulator of RcsB-dependent stress response